jgi:hypothetical protein
MSVSHALTVERTQNGVVRTVNFFLKENNVYLFELRTQYPDQSEPSVTSLPMSKVMTDLLFQALYQASHNLDQWKLPDEQQISDAKLL